MRNAAFLLILFIILGCSRAETIKVQGLVVNSTLAFSSADTNILPLTVGGGICQNADQPCVSVTICKPGTNDCRTIPDILVDTGSYGLRVFNTSLVKSLGLTPLPTLSGGQVAECYRYLDNSSNWGPVVRADVMLGGEQTNSDISIQIIDASFPGHTDSNCPNPDTSPADTRFNGILGIGSFVTDCGPACQNFSNNNFYFNCQNGTCASTKVLEVYQVSNPVAALQVDNNGVIISLPQIPSAGAQLVNGYLILGIGTRANNTMAAPSVFQIDSFGNFTTQFLGKNYSSFIDSGSNGLFFPITNTGLSIGPTGFFDTPKIKHFTAVQTDGFTSETIAFSILGSSSAFAAGSPNRAFNDIGAPLSLQLFDWGLPFFFGRNVHVGIENRASHLGTGPYWAY